MKFEQLGNSITDFDQANGIVTSRIAGVGGGTGLVNPEHSGWELGG